MLNSTAQCIINTYTHLNHNILGVTLGASLAAVTIILITLACLCIWNRKWKKRQQKAEVLSARSYNSNHTMSYLSNMVNVNSNTNPYQLTMEDRMRWTHISDAVTNASTNQELPYPPPSSDQANYPHRFQNPSDEESWYDYRTRPRSRMSSHPTTPPNASFYEMENPVRQPYIPSTYHSSKRFKNMSGMRY